MDETETLHKQVKVQHPLTLEDIEVDEALAPLLEELWSQGFKTDFSCQGELNYAASLPDGNVYVHDREGYIDFMSFDEAKLFCTLIERFVPEYGRWRWKLDQNPWESESPRTAVRFPPEHLPAITLGLTGKDVYGIIGISRDYQEGGSNVHKA